MCDLGLWFVSICFFKGLNFWLKVIDFVIYNIYIIYYISLMKCWVLVCVLKDWKVSILKIYIIIIMVWINIYNIRI